MSYTQRFSEEFQLLGHIHPASNTGETNTGYVSIANFHRTVVKFHAGVLGGDCSITLSQATDTGGAGGKTLNAGGKDVVVHNADDNSITLIEVRTEEFDVDGGFDCMNVQVLNPVASIYDVEVWGFIPRHAPVSTAALNAVVD